MWALLRRPAATLGQGVRVTAARYSNIQSAGSNAQTRDTISVAIICSKIVTARERGY